ncbi:MAG TPA: NfeD family protein [bacterium]|nr:NfeD family protein [bacterium]
MEWWIWAVAGLAFGLAEIATPGFYMIFFGVGAFAASAMSFVAPTSPLWSQILVFTLVSVISLVLFRKPLMKKFGMDKPIPSRNEIVHEIALAMEDIAPEKVGKAELRGSTWNARNKGTAALMKGQRCRVVKVEGLTLWLEPE